MGWLAKPKKHDCSVHTGPVPEDIEVGSFWTCFCGKTWELTSKPVEGLPADPMRPSEGVHIVGIDGAVYWRSR